MWNSYKIRDVYIVILYSKLHLHTVVTMFVTFLNVSLCKSKQSCYNLCFLVCFLIFWGTREKMPGFLYTRKYKITETSFIYSSKNRSSKTRLPLSQKCLQNRFLCVSKASMRFSPPLAKPAVTSLLLPPLVLSFPQISLYSSFAIGLYSS